MIEYEKVIKKLKSLSNSKAIIGMAKYEVVSENTYGISIPNLRNIAKEIGVNHKYYQKH